MARVLRTWGIFAIIFAGLTCGDLDQFEIEERSTSTVPAGTPLEQLIGDLGFGGFVQLDISENQELKNQGVSRNQIDSVHIASLTLTITAPPSGQDFSFIDEVSFFVEAPGLQQRRVAHGGPFADGLTTVGLGIDDVDLAPYVAADSMNITTSVQGRRPSQETTIEARLVLLVDVDVSGAVCGK